MNKVICIDFDGTCVTHEYPEVGVEIPHCVDVLKQLIANDVKIILWTMRSGDKLQNAVDWFEKFGVELWGINENPEQNEWTYSPKAYAQIYIDDAAAGCPLIYPDNNARPFVNWHEIEKILQTQGFI